MVGEIDHEIWIEGNVSRAKLLEFIETSRHECGIKTFYEA